MNTSITNTETKTTYTAKDFASNQDVKWCPGCGDYSILKQVQTILPEIGVPRENIVFISGIGCSSRFPYYMNTFGMHSIHGRAPAFVTGLKITNPELNVWMITGDGDALSIGGNHLIHILRRNVNTNILLFNNEIYGLTKGQYSPTSPEGLKTKSSPYGVVDHPFNPIKLAMGAEATFIARTIDRDPKFLRDILLAANEHKGSSFVEIYQNCIVFNDKAFEIYTDKSTKKKEVLMLNHNQPLIFGEEDEKAVILDGCTPRIVEWEKEGLSKEDLWIHDMFDKYKANILIDFFDDPNTPEHFPRPFGIFYKKDRAVYEEMVNKQIDEVKKNIGEGDLQQLLRGEHTWKVE
jgi:2-oxoglutarate ferredoxin oxidoreductase subunit beta